MDTVLAAISFTSSMVYIVSMLWLFYMFATAKTKEDLTKVANFVKLPIAMAIVALLCYMIRADVAYSIMSLIKVVGPMAMAWSATVRIKAMPKTQEELLIEEIERELYKL